MKDHYTLLHNFLEKHFPAQLPKLEAIKDNDVEVTMMYNMYKKSAKNALKERMESSKVEYKVAGRPVTLNKGEKSDGTDWTVTFKNGKTTALADVLALIEPEPELTMNEAKATCCHRCGRVHVKGSGCKRPYLRGKDSCAINEIETLKEFYNK